MNRLFILIVVVFLLGGCTKQPQKTVIKFMSWGSKSEVAIIQPLIQEFEKENPDIDIKFVHTPKNYFQKLHLLAASRLMPDVVFVNNINGVLYAENNLFMDLKPLFKERELFYQRALQAFNHKNSLYAVPRDISNLVIYYNKDIFDRCGVPYPSKNWTLDDFLETAQKLTRNGVWGISFREEPLFWLPYLLSNGGGILDTSTKKIIISNPQSIQALQFYSDLRNRHHIAPTRSETGSATMAQLFMQGRLAMHLSGRWFMPVYTREIDFNWGITTFPQGKVGSMVSCDASGWAISASTRHPKEAWRFVEFMSSVRASEKFTRSGLITPARKDVHDPEKVFTHAIEKSVPTPVTGNYQEIADILENRLEPVWTGRMSVREVLGLIRK